jgi:hypothetical protein
MGTLLRRALLRIVLVVTALVAPAQTLAHPHIWIDATLTLKLERERIDSVRVEWTFDEFFSAVLLEDFDLDRSGHFDEAETERIYDQIEPNLRILGYMTHVQAGLDYQKLERIRDFRAVIDDGVPGERVTPTGAAILRHLRAGASGPPVPTRHGSGSDTSTSTGMATKQATMPSAAVSECANSSGRE